MPMLPRACSTDAEVLPNGGVLQRRLHKLKESPTSGVQVQDRLYDDFAGLGLCRKVPSRLCSWAEIALQSLPQNVQAFQQGQIENLLARESSGGLFALVSVFPAINADSVLRPAARYH